MENERKIGFLGCYMIFSNFVADYNSKSGGVLLGRYWGIAASADLCLLCNFHCIALSGPFFEKWGGVTYLLIQNGLIVVLLLSTSIRYEQ